jgi:hypothetical protein
MRAGIFGPWWFDFFRTFFLRLARASSNAACSKGSVMGSATTRCKAAILNGSGIFLDVTSPYSWDTLSHTTIVR